MLFGKQINKQIKICIYMLKKEILSKQKMNNNKIIIKKITLTQTQKTK